MLPFKCNQVCTSEVERSPPSQKKMNCFAAAGSSFTNWYILDEDFSMFCSGLLSQILVFGQVPVFK